MRAAAVLVAVALIASCAPRAPASTPTKTYRIGYLSGLAASSVQYDQFRQALRERGYVEGQNATLETRFADGNPDRIPSLAAELVALKPDLIVVLGINVAMPLKKATSSIPIVVYAAADPAEAGLVTSLARPEGNITGAVSAIGPEIVGRRLQVFKEAVPTISRIGYFYDADANHVGQYERARSEAAAFGTQVIPLLVRTKDDFPVAFASAERERADALFLGEGSLINTQRDSILAFAAADRLPSMVLNRANVEAGALLAYGESELEIWRRVADYVDRILKGAKPADLPMIPSAKLDLIINMKTAKALGLTIPPSVLAQATELIQ